jgi:hypothetical protein
MWQPWSVAHLFEKLVTFLDSVLHSLSPSLSPSLFTRCDVVGTWSREYQLSSSYYYYYYYYQMRLCSIWSRDAENSSALFYVVKNVTKCHD